MWQLISKSGTVGNCWGQIAILKRGNSNIHESYTFCTLPRSSLPAYFREAAKFAKGFKCYLVMTVNRGRPSCLSWRGWSKLWFWMLKTCLKTQETGRESRTILSPMNKRNQTCHIAVALLHLLMWCTFTIPELQASLPIQASTAGSTTHLVTKQMCSHTLEALDYLIKQTVL